MKQSFFIGILGGVGAIASARFHLDLVEEWARTHNSQTDDDFPIIIHISHPLGLGAGGMDDKKLTDRQLSKAIQRLRPGCDRYAVICNSICPLLLKAPYILTPVVACKEALNKVTGPVWLLASDSTLRDRIYQSAYPEVDWRIPTQSMTPTIQQSLSRGEVNVDFALDIFDGETIVLGCTELSTANVPFPYHNVISPTDEMVRILCNTSL